MYFFVNRFLRKTPLCASRTETAWLFHEIGNCFLALGDFEYAKDAAKKSLDAAEEALEWSYQLQSCVLMGVAEGKFLVLYFFIVIHKCCVDVPFY